LKEYKIYQLFLLLNHIWCNSQVTPPVFTPPNQIDARMHKAK